MGIKALGYTLDSDDEITVTEDAADDSIAITWREHPDYPVAVKREAVSELITALEQYLD